MTNKQQLIDAVRTLIAALGPILVYLGLAEADANRYVQIAGMVVPIIVSVIWGIIDKSYANRALSAAAIPGVAVAVAPNAPESVKQIAAAEAPSPTSPVASVVQVPTLPTGV